MAIENLKVAEALKKLQEEMTALVESQTKTLRSQAEVVRDITSAYQEMLGNEPIEKLSKTKEALEDIAKTADKLNEPNLLKNYAKAIKDGFDKTKNLKKTLLEVVKTAPGFKAFTGVWKGFSAGISAASSTMRLMGSATMTAFEAMGQLAVGILAFPFRILSNLINFASQGGGDNSLRQALEDIRKEFGDLHKTSAKAIIGTARIMKGELANTGLTVWRTFGNLAERLKTIAEYAKNLGPIFANVAQQFTENAEVLGAYFKGLHLAEAGQKAIATRAFATGTSLAEMSRELANYSVQLADEFGLSAAQVSQDVGEMMADFEHFGTLAPQVLTNITVYARRLGVEVKGLLGVIDQFDNFENAAKSAAMLTQSFGLQLDALQLLKAEDPAERTEMLRKAFFAAGRSIESMTRQERALLQQQTGLEASTLDLVFSAKNQGLSYDTVKKKSDSARKSQLTQAESLQKIAGAIERLVKSGQMGQGGFFERFFQGFERGILRSREFREIWFNIRRALRATYWAGAEVGRVFVQIFPGVKSVFKGLAGIFDPTRFRSMLTRLKAIFREFFTSLTSGNTKDSVKNFIANLKSMFLDYFSGSTPAGRKILEGLKAFGKAFATILGGLLREAISGITTGVRFITDLLSGRTKVGGTGGASEAMKFISELIEPIVDAVVESWPALKQAFIDLWAQVWPRVRDFLSEHALLISAVLFGPGLVSGLVRGVGAAVGGAVIEGLTAGIGKAFASTAARSAVETGANSLLSGPSSALARTANASVAEGVTGAASLNAAGGGFGISQAVALGARLTAIAVALSVGAVAVAISIVAISHILRGTRPEEIAMSLGVIAATVLGMVGVSYAITLLQGASLGVAALMPAIKALAIGLVAIVGLSLVMAGNFQLLRLALSGVSPEDTGRIALALGAMTVMYTAGAGILIGAAVLGAAVAATGGAALALAIGGIAILGGLTIAMATNIRAIIGIIDTIPDSPGLQAKTDAFTSVFSTVTDFASILGNIIDAGAPSFMDLLSNPFASGDRVNTSFTLINQIVSSLGTGIRDLVDSIISYLPDLGTDTAKIKGAEVLGSVLGAVTNLAKAIQPPEGWDDGLVGTLFPAISLKNISNYMENIGPVLSALVPRVIEMMRIAASSLPSINPDAISAFSSFIQGVGSLVTAFAPSGSAGLALAGLAAVDVIDNSVMSLVGEEGGGGVVGFLQNMVAYTSHMLQALIGSGLFSELSKTLTSVIGSLGGLSEEQLKALPVVSSIIESVFGGVTALSSSAVLTPEMLKAMSDSGTSTGDLSEFMRNAIPAILEPIETFLPRIIDSLTATLASIPARELTRITNGVETLKGVFDLLGQIPTLVSSFSGMDTTGMNGGAMATTLSGLSGITASLFGESSPISNIISSFTKGGVLSGVKNIPANLGERFTALQGALSSITELSGLNLSEISDNLTKNAESIETASFVHIGDNIRAMVAEVNNISESLANIPAININTRLKTLAANIGLGSDETLTINNRNFNIQVNLQVNIDAEELERVLTRRPDSTIMVRPRT